MPSLEEKIDVLGVKIDAVNLTAAVQRIAAWVRERRKVYVCVAPVSSVMECQEDEQYRSIVNNADMVTPDGMPIVWLGRWQGHKEMSRTYGPDLLLAVCRRSEAEGYRHYFYGGTEATIDRLAKKLKEEFPRLTIAGTCSPPFRAVRELETEEMIRQINQARPDILWLGLGSPKQDYWMYQHRDRLDVPVMIGVGAAFDFIAGTKPQAPRWMQRSGLEWIFRLCCEPRRLWKRYIAGNSKFVYLLIKNSLRSGRRKVIR